MSYKGGETLVEVVSVLKAGLSLSLSLSRSLSLDHKKRACHRNVPGKLSQELRLKDRVAASTTSTPIRGSKERPPRPFSKRTLQARKLSCRRLTLLGGQSSAASALLLQAAESVGGD